MLSLDSSFKRSIDPVSDTPTMLMTFYPVRNPIAEDFQSRSITNHSFSLPRLAKIGHIYLQNKSNHFLWKNVAVSGFYCNVVLKTWVEIC